MRWKGWLFCDPEPEHCVSEETWNGGDGKISFNHVQQRPEEAVSEDVPDITTDVWGISDGAYTGPGGS